MMSASRQVGSCEEEEEASVCTLHRLLCLESCCESLGTKFTEKNDADRFLFEVKQLLGVNHTDFMYNSKLCAGKNSV